MSPTLNHGDGTPQKAVLILTVPASDLTGMLEGKLGNLLNSDDCGVNAFVASDVPNALALSQNPRPTPDASLESLQEIAK